MFELPTTGSLLRRTFNVFGAGFLPFFALALIVQLPILAVTFLVSANGQAVPVPSAGTVLLGLGIFLITTCLSMVASAALVYGVFQGLRGESMSLEKSFQLALSRLPSIIGLAILTSVVIVVGFVLCIIPGVVASCGLFVAAPVLMVEGKGATDSMNRSWHLTDGYRDKIFFVVLCLGVIQFILGVAVGLVAFWVPTAVGTVAQFLATGFGTALNAVASAVLYHDLRGFREGLGEDELVAVFD